MNPHQVAALSLAGLLAGSFSVAVLEAQPRPKASELLQRVRSTYSSLQSFRDRGEIEAVHSVTGAIESHRFDLASGPGGGYRFTLQSPDLPGEPTTVVWRDGAQVSVFDSTAGQTRAAGSLASEVGKSYGEGGLDALVVPAFLAGAADVLSTRAAAAVEGPEPCGGSGAQECWVLTLTGKGGARSRLWIDTATSLVRQTEVLLPAGAKRSRIRVRHQEPEVNPPLAAADLTFGGLPPKPEPVPEMAVVEKAEKAEDPALWIRGEERLPDDVAARLRREEAFQSEMTVAVAPIIARVYDPTGKPLLGLEPKDFVVRVGKSRKEIPLLAVDWVQDGEPLPEEAPVETPETPEAPEEPVETVAEILAGPSPSLELMRKMGTPPGKWVLFFVQGDLEPVRIKGHLALLMRVEKLLDTVGKHDRMALVSFDSKLRLRLDWTHDREAVREALRLAVRTGGDFSFPGDGSQKVSLADALGPDVGDAVNPEQALEKVADALKTLPGQKAVLFLGWGLGRATPQGMWYTQTFVRAANKLNEAQASVFVLDITHDDFHTLAAGLYSMAASTGGTYNATYKFPDRALKLLAQALSGYYVLTVDADDLPKDGRQLRIELRNSYRGTVRARPSDESRTIVQITD
jgi:VWFA-related protein